eukprot:scaffold5024_cov180-Isochrysis_galbana.AAC.1
MGERGPAGLWARQRGDQTGREDVERNGERALNLCDGIAWPVVFCSLGLPCACLLPDTSDKAIFAWLFAHTRRCAYRNLSPLSLSGSRIIGFTFHPLARVASHHLPPHAAGPLGRRTGLLKTPP